MSYWYFLFGAKGSRLVQCRIADILISFFYRLKERPWGEGPKKLFLAPCRAQVGWGCYLSPSKTAKPHRKGLDANPYTKMPSISNVKIIVAGLVFLTLLSLAGTAAYYRSAMQEAQKRAKVSEAQRKVAQDSLRVLYSDSSESTVAKLSFPSEDSLRAFAKKNFPADSLLEGKLKKTSDKRLVRSGIEFDWVKGPAKTDSTAFPTRSTKDSSVYDVRVEKNDYSIDGSFIATGYKSGERALLYDLKVSLNTQTFQILELSDGFGKEVYLNSPGKTKSLNAYHTPTGGPEEDPDRIVPQITSSALLIGKNVFGKLTGGAQVQRSFLSVGVEVGAARNLANGKTVPAGEIGVSIEF